MDSQEARDMLRLIDTVKYLIGIAERGEGRSIRDDETAEQFVLGYVKRLETCIERKYGTEECEGCADRDEEIDRLKDALRTSSTTFVKGNEMTNICENDRCTYHRPLPVKDAGAPYIDTIEDGERVRVERHLYRSRDGKRDFFLCDVCHAAVQMVVTPNAE